MIKNIFSLIFKEKMFKLTDHKFSNNSIKNLELFLDFHYYKTDFDFYVEMVEYIMCWESKDTINNMTSFFMIPDNKSIGFKITFLYYIKNRLKYNNILKLIDNKKKLYLTEISKFSKEELINFINKNKKSYDFYFYDECLLFLLALDNNILYSESYLFESEEECNFFEKNILTLNSNIIFKIINAIKYDSKYNIFKDNMILESPYHTVYIYYKNNKNKFNVLLYCNINNINDILHICNMVYEPRGYIGYDSKEKYCFKKYIKDSKFLSNDNINLELNYDNYLKYNYFIKYIIMNDMNYSICDCDGDLNAFEIKIHEEKISNIFFKHLNSKKGQLFVYDYDNTLALPKYKLWDGIINIKNKSSIPITPISISILSTASKNNKAIILTKRSYNKTKDIEIFLNKYKIDAVIIPMKHFLNKKLSKAEVLDNLWNKIPKLVEWGNDIKINELNFCDDLIKNMEGFDNTFKKKHNLININLNLVSLKNEYYGYLFKKNKK